MYAIVKTGGRQYQVSPGDILKIAKLNAKVGDKIALSEVLLIADGEDIKIGKPTVEKAKIEAEVVGEGRDRKIHIIKFRRRKHSMKRQGHRQSYTEIKINKINI